MTTTRVLIVDDHAFFSEMLCRTLAAEPGVEVVGVAQDGERAVRLVSDTNPDVVLMDIVLPGEVDGIAASLQIKRERPQIGIVILSVHNDREYVASLPLGASSGWAYLLKQSIPDVSTVLRAIATSVSGGIMLDPEVVGSLLPRPGSRSARLTPSQMDVLRLIAQGYNNAAVGEQLGLTEKTVETYTHNIYQQLELTSESGINPRVMATLIYLEEAQDQSLKS